MIKNSIITRTLLIICFVVYAAFLILVLFNSFVDQIMEFFPNELFMICALSYVPIFLLLRNTSIPRWCWYVAGLFIGIAFFSFPSTSADPFRYLFNGELIHRFHVSPYAALPINFPADHFSIFIRDIWWSAFPSPYGPLWDFFMMIINVLSKNSLLFGIVLLKILDGLFLWLCARSMYRYTKNSSLVFLFIINPVILLNVFHTPHPDIALAFFLLLSLVEKSIFRSAWGIVLASLIKIHSLAFAPLWLGTSKILDKIKMGALAAIVSLLFLQMFVHFNYVEMVRAYVGGGAIVKTTYLLFSNPLIGLVVFGCLYAVVYGLFLKHKLTILDAYLAVSLLIPILLLGTCYPWHFIVPLALLFSGRPHPLSILFITVVTFMAPINIGLFLVLAVATATLFVIYRPLLGFGKKQLTF